MTVVVAAFLVSFLVALVGTLAARNRARTWGMYDAASSSRKVHRTPIPRLGGVGIVLGFFATPALLLWVGPRFAGGLGSEMSFVLALLAGGAIIAGLGLYDDLRGAGARLKLFVQVGVALLLYALGARVEAIASPFGPPLSLGALSLPLTVFWVVGIINALNLIDGLDGLAGGVTLFAVGTHFVLAFLQGDVLVCVLMAALAGAVVAFLVFNFNPASIFMGDTGSMFLGLVLAAVSLRTSSTGDQVVALLVPVAALGLPILDTLLAMTRRALVGRPLFSADKEHIHHRVMGRLQLGHRGTVLFLYGVCGLFSLTALGLSFANGIQSALLLTGSATACFALLRMLGYLSPKEAGAFSSVRRRNQELRAVVNAVAQSIRAARSLPEVSDSMRPLVDVLKAQQLILEVAGREQQGEQLRFEIARAGGDSHPVESRQALKLGGEALGNLVLVWRDSRREVDRDEELAI
ncbi:MAG: undecaprenyl/decaprenyl-phosphate alpha-N-acetylglucosaminyl 1-phosphate transferase, partial [Myxococcaceae bacterium]|nr:undecaprenyl/decaprenyl-phosphate alpha-N-acetylglucosaminyl 1-phosphate transferase [Myxococcaceae bacterium]MCI0671547.1 undecaprenyl/decaprenyl-phosphate alpha-N-acetylglucosaminyl 1-phosphate transferase [Myxococcaceae bacterium]